MRKAKWLFAFAAITAVIAVMAACNNPAGGGTTTDNNNQTQTCTHVWGDWARVIANPPSMVTTRTCTVSGCNEQQTFTGGIHVQPSLIVPGTYRNKEMVRIPAGSIMGGVMFGTTPITQSHDFWMSRHQVTRAQWHAVMGTTPWIDSWGAGAPANDIAVTNVSWYDVIVFANKLSIQTPNLNPVYEINIAHPGGQDWRTDPADWKAAAGGVVPAGNNAIWNTVRKRDANGYRLPTSAQWEYAARAGTTTLFNDGVPTLDFDAIDLLAWTSNNSGGQVQEVGQLRPNAWGLYDMHGNVREWCWDVRFDRDRRAFRGTSWAGAIVSARSGFSGYMDKSGRWNLFGFRLVRPAN